MLKFLIKKKIILLILAVQFPLETVSARECLLPANESRDINLDGSCIYNEQITISQSNIKLNCNGATINGANSDAMVGVLLTSRNTGLRNVSIENCKIINFKNNGIRISSGVPIYKLSNSKSNNYINAPSNIVISNVQIVNTGRVGLYIDSYVTKLLFRDSLIKNSGMSGVYLEQATRNNIIKNNKIINNGGARSGVASREGISVDSSAYNKIIDNYFEGNAAGGIFLYKNCGEKIHSGKSEIRWQHSDNNEIINNVFKNEPVGVWIASRQSRNLQKWDCGDSPMDNDGVYYQDYANSNIIKNNTFCKSKIGVLIEGDNNIVENNTSDMDIDDFLKIPITKRGELLNLPPVGNVSKNNVVRACESKF